MANRTVDELFRVRVEDQIGTIPVWYRTLSDVEVQAREQYALLARAKLAKALRDPESDDALRREQYLVDATAGDLYQLLADRRRQELQREAAEHIQGDLIPLPDQATPEEILEVWEAREAQAKRLQKERDAFVQQGLAEQHAETPREDLVKHARRAYDELQVTGAHSVAWNRYTLYAGLYKDAACQKRYFLTPEMVGELSLEARNLLLANYFRELGQISSLDLQYFLSTGAWRASSKPSTGSVETPETILSVRPAS